MGVVNPTFFLSSFPHFRENRLDDLLKQSKPIGNKEKYKEIKTLVQEQYNEKKKQEKEQNKKRKQTESSTDGKPKKSRVKPERVMEVAAKLTEVLVSNFKLGIKEMPLVNLALKAGFKNHRSDAPADAMKLLKKQGFVKVNANKVSLTDKGVEEYITEEDVVLPEDPTALVEMYWTQLEKNLRDTKKGSGEKPLSAAARVWELLKDGKAHDMEEVLAVAKYQGENSAGMEEIKRQLKLLGLAVKENKQLKFTEKVLKPLFGN